MELRLLMGNDKYRLEAYWSRCHVGVRHRADGRHVWLVTTPNMKKNIEAANFVVTLLVQY